MTDDARETAPTPSQVYARGASEGQWQNDPAQHPALAELDDATLRARARTFEARPLVCRYAPDAPVPPALLDANERR